MKRLLTEAAVLGDATARANLYSPRQKGYFVYPDSDSSWVMGFANKDVFFEVDGARNLDARTSFYFGYTGVTPAMAVTHPGAGSDYGIAFRDAGKNASDGSKTYKLHLPPDVPVNNFWARHDIIPNPLFPFVAFRLGLPGHHLVLRYETSAEYSLKGRIQLNKHKFWRVQ